MKSLILIFLPLLSLSSSAQYNFGFEEYKPGTDTLAAWNLASGRSYFGPQFTIDKEIKHSGDQSFSIERKITDTSTQFTPVSVWIPVNFEGNNLTASCWLKTQNAEGYAQMWLRIDDENKKMLSLTNYPRTSLTGTTDWTQYTANITLPEDARIIYFGFLISGTGKVWGDDLSLSVDGKRFDKVAKNVQKRSFPAAKDNKEFEKGSGITINTITDFQKENLSLLGKVWGFLKYYHPFVAEGNLNWDYELFRFLPSYLLVNNKEDRNKLLLQWINKLEKPKPCNDCSDEILQKAIYKPDLDWLNNNSLLGDSLSSSLIYIKNNRHQGKKYYMDLVTGVENPKINHEPGYEQFPYPDAGYRLLTLFRYWNLIQYWFPYKHLIGEDWKNVLTEFVPKMIGAANKGDYVSVTQQLIGRIHDTHANIWGGNKTLDSLKGNLYSPLKIKFIDEQAVVAQIPETLLSEPGISVGDIIISIDGKKISDIIKERLPNLPASNYPTQLRDLASQLLRSNDSVSTIIVQHNGKEYQTILKRWEQKKITNLYSYDFPYQKDSSFFFIKPGIGYINLGKIKSKQLDSVFNELKDSKGLIIDNRQYPGDFPIYSLAEKIMPEKKEFTKIPVGSLDYPGMFTTKAGLSVGKKNNKYYKGKVIILVNENTQSSGEFHSMAFRIAPDATVMGSTTAGADGNISGFYLPGGIYTMFSGISILYPDGTETQRAGIVPDIEVKPTIEGIKKGKDELVEKAAELINISRPAEIKKKGF